MTTQNALIIIVDDEKKTLLPLEQILSGEGPVVQAFSSSAEAQAHLKTKTADLQNISNG